MLHSDFKAFQVDAIGSMQGILAELRNGRAEYEMLRNDFRAFQVDAIGNMRGLHIATLAWSMLMHYMQNIRKVSDEDKPRLHGTLEEARQLVNIVLNEIKATDEFVLSLTYSVYGIILYFDKKFEDALDLFRKSLSKDRENGSSAYNLACCACKLADELDLIGVADKTRIVALESEALTSLAEALKLQPWRKTEVLNEGDFGDLQRIREHPQFKLLIS